MSTKKKRIQVGFKQSEYDDIVSIAKQSNSPVGETVFRLVQIGIAFGPYQPKITK